MSRITGTDAANLIEAYNSLYAPQEEVELTEEQVQEDFENWVNSLVEEGRDLSEHTWEDMYEIYLSEAIGQPGSAGMVNWKDQQTGQVRSGYKSSSDGKLYKNYNDALAAKNSRMQGLAVQQGLNRTYRAGGGNAAVAQGRNPLDVMRQGSTNLQRQQQRPTVPTSTASTRPPAAPTAPATRPTAPVSQRPAPSPAAPARPTTPAAPAATTPAAPARTFNPLMQRTFGYQTGNAPDQIAKASQGTSQATSDAAFKRSREMVNKMRSTPTLSQSFDIFDIVKGYLIDEGYAETEQAAAVIMANMSEEWRHSIMEVVTTTGEKAPKAVPSQMFPNAPRMGAERPFQEPFINPSGAPFKGASKSVKKDIKTA